MTIPIYLLEDCKQFCEKLQSVVGKLSLTSISVDEEKNIIAAKLQNIFLDNLSFKYFLVNTIKIGLITKRLYDDTEEAFSEINYRKFISFVTEYQNSKYQQIIMNNDSLPVFFNLQQLSQKFPYITKEELFLINTSTNKYYTLLYKYVNFHFQKEVISFDKDSLIFSLKYFSISNFQCIKHIEAQLPVDAQFVVFTGENGDGKTSILQALGLGFYNTKDLTDNEKGNTETAITVQYKANENSYHNEIYNNPKFPTLYSLRNNIEELKNFAAYGASRLTISEKKDLQNPLLNLITEKSKLYDITETWLRDIAVNEPKKYEAVCDILVSLLPNVSEIRKANPTKIVSDLIFIEKGVPMELKNLSAGHKSIVLMIGDMIMRLSEAQPEINNPEKFAGIVLIDELETHLHPKWQKDFPKILADIFKKVQFIITTHSAITLLGMPKNTVFFKVTRTEEAGTQIERLEIDVENLLPNQILTSPLFDMNSLKSTTNKDVNAIRLEDNFQEIVKRDEVRNDIAKILSEKFKKQN
jgi:predicted ATPase